MGLSENFYIFTSTHKDYTFPFTGKSEKIIMSVLRYDMIFLFTNEERRATVLFVNFP